MRIVAFLVGLACLSPVAGCSLTEADTGLPYRNVEGAGRLLVAEPGTFAFNDAVSWESFWVEHAVDFEGRGALPPAPDVDFERETVAAVFLGTRSGCGYFIELVREVRMRGDAALVEIGPPSPPSHLVCDMVVFPAHIVAFDKVNAVRFTGDVPGKDE